MIYNEIKDEVIFNFLAKRLNERVIILYQQEITNFESFFVRFANLGYQHKELTEKLENDINTKFEKI